MHVKQNIKLTFLQAFLVILLMISVNLAYSQTTYYSRINGSWTDPSTWSTTACGGAAASTTPGASDNVIICSGNTVTLNANSTIVDVQINAGSTLDIGNRVITLNGDLTIDGYVIGQNGTFIMNNNSDISGTGTIKSLNNASFTVNADITITSTDLLIFSDNNINPTIIEINNDASITNSGQVTVIGDIVGGNAGSSWINAANSTLTLYDNIFSAKGTLYASANGNTIEYYGSDVVQDIKTPDGSTYYNLLISGSEEKEQQADIIIKGDFTINSGTYDCNNHDIDLKGDWYNQGTFSYGTGKVSFSGTSDQSLSNIAGQTFYDLTINKTSGAVLLNDNVTVNETLTMTQGNINSGDDKITVGTSSTDYGTLSHSSGQVIGKYEKWITSDDHSNVKQLFPVGTASYCRPAEPTFITFNASGEEGSVVAEFVAEAPGNAGLALQDPPQTDPDSVFNTFNDGYWILTPANGISITDYDLELTGNGFSAFGIDSETRLLTRSGAGNDWNNEGTHVSAAGNTAKRTGLSTMGAHYCFGDDTDCEGPVTSPISGKTDVCVDEEDVEYYVNNTAGSVYTWTITGGTIDSGQGNDTVVVNWGSDGMAGNVKVVENNGCTNGNPVNLDVTIHPIKPTLISGQSVVPVGTTGEEYSVVDTLGYTYTWTITGGTLASGQGTNSITVDWNSTVGWGEIKVVASDTCDSAPAAELDVYKYYVINSIATGSWDDTDTWDCHCVPLETDNVIINNGHTVSINSPNTAINHITIAATGILDCGNKAFIATGNFIVDGKITGTNTLTLSGNNTNIGGVGTIENNKELTISGGNKTLSSNAMLTKTTSNVTLESGISVTNKGSFSVQNGNLTFNTGSSWQNDAYSTLQLGGEISLTTGSFFATATDNTVNYYKDGDQDIRSTTYYHLTTSASGGTGTKTLDGDVIVKGDLTIETGATCDASANNYDINIRGDWINNGTFTRRLGTVTFDGNTIQTIEGTTANTFYDIAFNNSGGNNADILLEDNNLTVSNSSTFTNGIVNTGTNTFIFNASATTNEGTSTSFIDGKASKLSATAEFTFPTGDVNTRDIGDGMETYKIQAPFSATPASSTDINVEYFYSNDNLHTWWYTGSSHESPLTHSTDREYWLVNSSQDLDVTLFWRDNDPCTIHDFCDGGSQLQYLTTAYWDNIWKDAGGDASGESTLNGDISSSISIPFVAKGEKQITFAGTSSKIPLPVELLNFDVTCDHENHAIDISWSTASEINNDYFTIYRSVDGDKFEEIKRITGSGTTSEPQTYSFTDNHAPVGDIYYKLSQTDFDGLTENFMITSINCFTPDDNFSLKVFPNPFREHLNIVFTNWPEDKTTLRLIDMQGRLILQKSEIIQGINTQIQLSFDDLLPGMYMLNLCNNLVNKT